MTDWTLLQGVIGSRAHGTSHPDSDTDRVRVFAAPTTEVAGLHWNRQKEAAHKVDEDGDFYHYEIGNFLRLCLSASPAVLEVLFLSDYEHQDEFGKRLVDMRYKFLSEAKVRNAYYHCANNMLANAKKARADKVYKVTWHAIRFARQGRQLLETGTTSLRVDRAEFEELTGLPLEKLFIRAHEEIGAILGAKSMLPESPDTNAVARFLEDVRVESVVDSLNLPRALYED